MQKRSKYAVSYYPLELPEEFPFIVSPLFVQRDREITWLHHHNYPELGYCWKGNGIFVVGSKVMPFKAGDIVVISPRELHLAQSVPGTNSFWNWIYFDPEKLLFPAFDNPELIDMDRFYGPNFHNVITREEQPNLCRLVKALIECDGKKMSFRKERLLALLGLFSIDMHTLFANLDNQSGKISHKTELLKRLNSSIQYLGCHFNHPLAIDKLCKLSNLSPSHFRRIFRQATGRSPREYLLHLRIGMAMAELRREEHSISEIALICGFNSLSSFNRQFKLQTGKSPREWNKLQRSVF